MASPMDIIACQHTPLYQCISFLTPGPFPYICAHQITVPLGFHTVMCDGQDSAVLPG